MNYGLEAGLAELAVAPVHPTVEEVVSFFFWRGLVIGAAMCLLFHRSARSHTLRPLNSQQVTVLRFSQEEELLWAGACGTRE